MRLPGPTTTRAAMAARVRPWTSRSARPGTRLRGPVRQRNTTYVIPPRCNRTHENGALAPSAYRQWTGHRWPRRNREHQRHEHHEPVETGRWPILFLDDRRAMMAITSRHEVREAPVGSRYGTRKVVAIGVAIGCVLGAGSRAAPAAMGVSAPPRPMTSSKPAGRRSKTTFSSRMPSASTFRTRGSEKLA